MPISGPGAISRALRRPRSGPCSRPGCRPSWSTPAGSATSPRARGSSPEPAERNHRHAAAGAAPEVLKGIDRHIAHLQKLIDDLEGRTDRIVAGSDTFRARDGILQSIVGIGPQVSRTLLVRRPEPGQGDRPSITALVGLAPFADDSGLVRRRHGPAAGGSGVGGSTGGRGRTTWDR